MSRHFPAPACRARTGYSPAHIDPSFSARAFQAPPRNAGALQLLARPACWPAPVARLQVCNSIRRADVGGGQEGFIIIVQAGRADSPSRCRSCGCGGRHLRSRAAAEAAAAQPRATAGGIRGTGLKEPSIRLGGRTALIYRWISACQYQQPAQAKRCENSAKGLPEWAVHTPWHDRIRTVKGEWPEGGGAGLGDSLS